MPSKLMILPTRIPELLLRVFFSLVICSMTVTAGLHGLTSSKPAHANKNSKSDGKSKEDKSLVRVAVMSFIDEKDQKKYKYLAESISNALNNALKKKFVYQNTSSIKNKRTLKDIRKQKPKKKNRPGQNDPLNIKSNVKALAKKNNLDIIVFGSYYTYHKAGTTTVQIVIKSQLYLSFFGEFITLEEVANPIDSTIFNVTDLLVGILIDKISALTGFQQALGVTVIAPQYSRVGSGKGVVKSQIPLARRENTILSEEAERLKNYLTDIFGGDIFELSEYAATHADVKPPPFKKRRGKKKRRSSAKNMVRWQKQHKIDNLFKVAFDQKQFINIMFSQKGQPPFTVSYSALLLLEEDIENAYSKLSSILRERSGFRPPLYKKSFTRSWNAVYLETGLAGGAGLVSLGQDSPLLSPQGRLFARFSPGAYSEKNDVELLSDFTHPILRPVFFDLSLGFASFSSEGPASDQKNNHFQNNFSSGIYSFSLGAGYSWIFLRRMRLLTGTSFAYYLAASGNSFMGDAIPAAQEVDNLTLGPSFLGYASLHYLWFFHLSLGIRTDYIHYFSQSISESSANNGRIGLSMEVTYVF